MDTASDGTQSIAIDGTIVLVSGGSSENQD
jgi:hypothetical protein